MNTIDALNKPSPCVSRGLMAAIRSGSVDTTLGVYAPFVRVLILFMMHPECNPNPSTKKPRSGPGIVISFCRGAYLSLMEMLRYIPVIEKRDGTQGSWNEQLVSLLLWECGSACMIKMIVIMLTAGGD